MELRKKAKKQSIIEAKLNIRVKFLIKEDTPEVGEVKNRIRHTNWQVKSMKPEEWSLSTRAWRSWSLVAVLVWPREKDGDAKKAGRERARKKQQHRTTNATQHDRKRRWAIVHMQKDVKDSALVEWNPVVENSVEKVLLRNTGCRKSVSQKDSCRISVWIWAKFPPFNFQRFKT